MKKLSQYFSLFMSGMLVANSGRAAVDMNVVREYIYLVELAIIGLVALALALVTSSIFHSRQGLRKTIVDFREEVRQEKLMLQVSLDELKEKEQKLMQLLRSGSTVVDAAVVRIDSGSTDNDKADEAGVVVPEGFGPRSRSFDAADNVLAEENTARVNAAGNHDPRAFSVDGSRKQQHQGPENFLGDLKAYYRETVSQSSRMHGSVIDVLGAARDQARDALNETEQQHQRLADRLAEMQQDFGGEKRSDKHKSGSQSSQLLDGLSKLESRIGRLKEYQQELVDVYKVSSEEIVSTATELEQKSADESGVGPGSLNSAGKR